MAIHLKAAGHPTAHAADPRAGQRTSPPLRSPGAGCALLFGLAPGGVCRVSLRHPTRKPVGGIVTVALVLVSRRTGVTRHPALGSSDFPHASTGRPGRHARPSGLLADHLILRRMTKSPARSRDQGRSAKTSVHRPALVAALASGLRGPDRALRTTDPSDGRPPTHETTPDGPRISHGRRVAGLEPPDPLVGAGSRTRTAPAAANHAHGAAITPRARTPAPGRGRTGWGPARPASGQGPRTRP
jgi:hypothetical protein